MASTSRNKLPSFMWDHNLLMSSDGISVFCSACECEFKVCPRTNVKAHLRSKRHLSLGRKPTPEFCKDLCEMLISGNITLNKIDHPHFNNFLLKYCKCALPSEKYLRNNCMNRLYAEVIVEIMDKLADKPLWLGVGDTRDSQGKPFAKLVVGALDSVPSKSYLVTCKILEGDDATHIVSFIQNNLPIYIPQLKPEKVSLLITKPAPHMLKVGKILQENYENMIHFPCMTRILHNIEERLKEKFNLVNRFINTMNKTFFETRKRIAFYKYCCPMSPVPPKLVQNKWGTWLSAVNFYARNITPIKTAIIHIESEANSIRQLNRIIRNVHLKRQLDYISRTFGHIPNCISRLGLRKVSITEAFDIFEYGLSKIHTGDEFGKAITAYIHEILENYPGFKKLRNIACALRHNDVSNTEFSYAPTTNYEIERCISISRSIADCNRSFTPVNLERYIVTQANKSE